MKPKKPTGNRKRPSNRRNSPIRPKTTRRAQPAAQAEESSFDDKFKRVDDVQSSPEQTADDDTTVSDSKKGQGIRLQKLLADRGYGSRRKMEGWIKQGDVEVNGKAAELGQRVTPRDNIKVKGYALRSRPAVEHAKVLMYNKPEGEICTMNDPRRRPTVFRNLPKIRGARWVTVGRLDINTSGLLLFTTNGELANKLMHPSTGIDREYRCRIFGEVNIDIVKQLLAGIEIDGHLMKFSKVEVENLTGETRNKWVHVTLSEGRNREVRKLWEAVDCQVSRLTRVRYGFLTLPRNLRPGKHRDLTPKEIQRLLAD